MKNKEKFLKIFTTTIITLSILYVIKCYIDMAIINQKLDEINKEIGYETGEIKEEYSSEIEERIQNYLHINESENPRKLAVAFYVSDVVFENMLEVYKVYGSITGVVNLLFYSLAITIFIYAMVTLEYKNKKQYLIAHGIILVFYLLIIQIESLIYYSLDIYSNNILPLLYLTFLTGNAIKNKKQTFLLNMAIIDLIVILNVMLTAITGTIDISWGFVLCAILPILVIEGIAMLINKIKEKTKENKDK